MSNLKQPSKNTSTYQYLATICANLLIISHGTSAGWPSVSFGTLQSEHSPLGDGALTTTFLTTHEISWIFSMSCMGGLIGTIIFGVIVNLIGRKSYICLLAIPQITSWTLIIFGTNVYELYLSRFLNGFCGGGAYIFIPLLVTEFAEDNVRGTLGTIISVSCNLGVLLTFIAGNLVSYYDLSYIMITIPVVFLLVFVWFPESPIYLMMNNKPKEAENAMKVYRNCRRDTDVDSDYFQNEMRKIQCYLPHQGLEKEPNTLMLSDFFTRPARKALMISLALFTLKECSGCFILISYTARIFAEAGSSISTESAAVIVAFIQLIGTYVSTILIDRIGRKPLLIFSSLGSALSLAGLGTYMYLNQLGWDLQSISWLPVIAFASQVFIAACGIVPISFVIMTEIMPTKILSVGTSVCLCHSWLLAFILLKIFPIISEAIGLHMSIAFFAVSSFGGMLFVILVMPETKGTSFDEIQLQLERK